MKETTGHPQCKAEKQYSKQEEKNDQHNSINKSYETKDFGLK